MCEFPPKRRTFPPSRLKCAREFLLGKYLLRKHSHFQIVPPKRSRHRFHSIAAFRICPKFFHLATSLIRNLMVFATFYNYTRPIDNLMQWSIISHPYRPPNTLHLFNITSEQSNFFNYSLTSPLSWCSKTLEASDSNIPVGRSQASREPRPEPVSFNIFIFFTLLSHP